MKFPDFYLTWNSFSFSFSRIFFDDHGKPDFAHAFPDYIIKFWKPRSYT